MLVDRQHGTPSRHDAGAVALPLKSALAALIAASVMLNLLALNGPLFMLQVYDRVLSSHSIQTLVGLCVLAGGLFGFQALLDALRARILLRVGEGFDARFARPAFRAVARLPLAGGAEGDGMQPQHDVDTVRSFLSGPGPGAFFDLPWMPFYLGICFLFHVWLGVTALAGAVILVAVTLATDLSARRPARRAMEAGAQRASWAGGVRDNAESVHAMGMEERLFERWRQANVALLAAGRASGDMSSAMGGLSRAARQALQSAILAVGAWLVIRQEASPGVMIAASIMMGRAMAPVDSAIAQWKHFVAARQSWRRIRTRLAPFEPSSRPMALPAPSAGLRAENVTLVPPGTALPTVFDISFDLAAGSALGIIGPSGSGKSTLARALTGIWPPSRGSIRLDGAAIDQWTREALGSHVGYLPQDIELFAGTVAENIARFHPDASSAAVIAAAKAADVHELIVRLPEGYDSMLGRDGGGLSSGQRQRIGLARALFGDPFLVVLDEPNANLDAEGEAAVTRAIASIRARGGIAVVIAHRPSAIAAVDSVMVMEAGRCKALGPRDEILTRTTQPAKAPPGGRFVRPLRVVVGENDPEPHSVEETRA